MTVFIVGDDEFYATPAQLEELVGKTDDIAVSSHFFDGDHTCEVGSAGQAALKAVSNGTAVMVETEEALTALLKARRP